MPKIAINAHHRRGIEDHAAALGHHAVGHGLGAVEHAPQIDIDHPVKLFQAHFLQPGILGDARVIDQHIDAPELRQGVLHHGVDHFTLGHIDHPACNGHAQGFALGHSRIDTRLTHVANHDGGPFLGKFEGGGQANALGGTGDDADFAGQPLGGEVVHGDEKGGGLKKY